MELQRTKWKDTSRPFLIDIFSRMRKMSRGLTVSTPKLLSLLALFSPNKRRHLTWLSYAYWLWMTWSLCQHRVKATMICKIKRFILVSLLPENLHSHLRFLVLRIECKSAIDVDIRCVYAFCCHIHLCRERETGYSHDFLCSRLCYMYLCYGTVDVASFFRK